MSTDKPITEASRKERQIEYIPAGYIPENIPDVEYIVKSSVINNTASVVSQNFRFWTKQVNKLYLVLIGPSSKKQFGVRNCFNPYILSCVEMTIVLFQDNLVSTADESEIKSNR